MDPLQLILSKIPKLLPQMEIHVVGGAVRDRLLGRKITDIDLVIEKNPNQWGGILAVKLNGTAFPLDEDRGITRISFGSDAHIDLAQRQGDSWPADMARRDFTINSLYVPLTTWLKPQWKKGIIDLHKGLTDLQKRHINIVSQNVFKDDPVRLLRAFRIGAELSFNLTPKTLQLISQQKSKLKQASPERVRDEILKLCSTPDAFSYFSLMAKTGLMDIFYPESKSLKKLAPQYYGRGGVLKHSLDGIHYFEAMHANLKEWFPKYSNKIKQYLKETEGGIPRYAHLKWALLLHDIGKAKTAKMIKGRMRFFNHEYVGSQMIGDLAERYRWSNDERQLFIKLAQNHMRPGNLATHPVVSDKAIHRFFRDLGNDAIAMLIVSLADHLTYLTPHEIKNHNSPHEKVTRFMIHRFYSHRNKVLPSKLLNGHDIMTTFQLYPSPIIGKLLTEVMENQSEGKIKTKEEAFEFLRKRLPHYSKELQNFQKRNSTHET